MNKAEFIDKNENLWFPVSLLNAFLFSAMFYLNNAKYTYM